MPPKKQETPSEKSTKPGKPTYSKKRKQHPQSSSNNQQSAEPPRRDFKRVKTGNDARSIRAQTSDSALKDGELNVQSFLKSREFEIKALQDGMQKAKAGRNGRAFQQVPRDLRRRTASHNVKRVPKRLQKKAAREMKEDNTPTVNANKRKPRSTRGRLRAETAKRLGILATTKKDSKAKFGENHGIETRTPRPKLRKDMLNDPPKPKAKFRKRQIHKTWLPTHLWHAKRATMTEPKNPLWRFSIPLTSTEKSYRPTHRAGGARGAVAWDMSYMSTIGLEGQATSLEKLLKAVGVKDEVLWAQGGKKWRDGKRTWNGWLAKEANEETDFLGPSTILWCPPASNQQDEGQRDAPRKTAIRKLFVRIHPAAFLETWTEMLRLSKLQRPAVHIQDLRFELGSIEITGPSSTEALLGILQPYRQDESQEAHAKVFSSLNGVTNASTLPTSAVLSFSIMDPRLHYPPRPVKPPNPLDTAAEFALLEMLSTWPVDEVTGSPDIFDRDARLKATRLPSQKALNRRKALEKPGSYPSVSANDPPIPIVLFTTRSAPSESAQGTWTLLAPWKCILPIWYGLMHYPLSSGANPRFGGLQELRQLHFERSKPWFPADYPGTIAGLAWEAEERLKKKSTWDKRPKGKRIEYDTLDLGAGRKGEIGQGWACDFERIIGVSCVSDATSSMNTTDGAEERTESKPKPARSTTCHLLSKDFASLLTSSKNKPPSTCTLATVRVSLVGRGVATPCARIYRLPRPSSNADSSKSSIPTTTREQWLSLLPPPSTSKPLPNPKKKGQPTGRIPLNTPLPERVRLLAKSLLRDPPVKYPAEQNEDGHPLCPDEEDLIGFVTTGEFNLAEGKGTAVGSVVVAKVLDGMERDGKNRSEDKLCIVRNSGETIGRLGMWEVV